MAVVGKDANHLAGAFGGGGGAEERSFEEGFDDAGLDLVGKGNEGRRWD